MEGINKLNKLILTLSKKFTLAVSSHFRSHLLASLTLTKSGPRHAPSLLVRMTDKNSELPTLCALVTEVKVKRDEVTSMYIDLINIGLMKKIKTG